MAHRGFGVHLPSLNTHASRIGDRADRVGHIGTQTSGAAMHGNALGQVGGSATASHQGFVSRAQSLFGRASKALHGQRDRMTDTSRAISDNENTHANGFASLHRPQGPPRIAGSANLHGNAFGNTGPSGQVSKPPKVHWAEGTVFNDGKQSYPRPPVHNAPNPATTGGNTHHLSRPPSEPPKPADPENHRIDTAAHGLAQDTQTGFSNKKRPGMANALGTFDGTVYPHTSMKTQGGRLQPNRHPLVDHLLDNIPPDRRSDGHGNCAEVGSISNYLHQVNPQGDWTVQDARNHFEHKGGATVAYIPGHDPQDSTPPCKSCNQLTSSLGIHPDRKYDYEE